MVGNMRGGSATFERIYSDLHRSRRVNLHVNGCSEVSCPMDVFTSGGGFYRGAVGRQDIWVDDVGRQGQDLMGITAHEFVEAAVSWGMGGVTCEKNEARHACVERWEGVIRSELGIKPREPDEKEGENQ
jgi:hypothetical protein